MPARKKTRNKPDVERFKRYFNKHKIRFSTGVVIFILGFYCLISCISFLIYGSEDLSIADINYYEQLKNSNIEAHNWGGKLGNIIAYQLINNSFGIASFVLIIGVMILGLILTNFSRLSVPKIIFNTFFIAIWLSVSIGFVVYLVDNSSYVFLGGTHGFFLAKWLHSLIGAVGVIFLILTGLILYLIMSTDKFYQWAYNANIKIKPLNRAKPQDKKSGPENPKKEDIAFNNMPPKSNTPREIDLDDDETEIEKHITDEEKDFSAQSEQLKDRIEEPEEDTDGLDFTVVEKSNEKDQRPADSIKPYDQLEDFDPTLDLSNYKFPKLNLLQDYHDDDVQVSKGELISNKNKIIDTLKHYNIEITSIKATIGPTVTLYEIVPAPGIRISKIKNLEDDIALNLAALGIRIIAPIPGKGTVGIEVPNQNPEIVSMRSIIASNKFQECKFELPVALGKTISNEVFIADLTKMPHMLVAGATGQGKSVGINAIITSLLYKKHPAQLKFVLVDPKKVELSIYSTLEKYYLAKLPEEEDPIITDIGKVVKTLHSLTVEMEQRYELLKKAKVRNLKEYNQKFIKRNLNPEKGHRYLPYIVLIIDEFADLIMTAGKEIELPIARIAQLARAVGIHMIIATQRPSTNIITGVIKANFPTRVAFKVASMIDSRTILDSPGANQLIGRGDMLITMGSDLIRLQCAFVDTAEVESITHFISQQQSYPSAFMLPEYVSDEEAAISGATDVSQLDNLFQDAARIIVAHQSGSTSLIQRRFSIGYNRAGRIMDQLEAFNIVGPNEGSKARQVLLPDEYALEQHLKEIMD